MKNISYSILGIFFLATACQPIEPINSESTGSARVAVASGFTGRLTIGTVRDRNISEISGVAASRRNPGRLWVHEDSNRPNKVYLLDEQGNTKAILTLPSNNLNRDWEDIAVGPGPVLGKTYIYLADIGDNAAEQSKVYVYRFEEPLIPNQSAIYTQTLSSAAVQKLDFRYADGARNAETLMIAPNRDLYIITKEGRNENGEDSKEKTKYVNKGGIYRAAYPQAEQSTTTLTRTGEVKITLATGGDISADGNEVLIKNESTVYHWSKTSNPSQAITDLLRLGTRTPLSSYQRENQGEAIGWKVNGSGFYTISEGSAQPIYYYPR